MNVLDFLDYVLPTIHGNTLFFFDPPYYNKGSQLYANYFKHEDYSELSRRISQIADKSIVNKKKH